MKVVVKKGAPRNPFVALARFRKAGGHGKSEKALRRHEKVAAQKALKADGTCGFGLQRVAPIRLMLSGAASAPEAEMDRHPASTRRTCGFDSCRGCQSDCGPVDRLVSLIESAG